MRIAFLDLGNIEYDPLTVDSAPVGGTESAVLYLSRSLARQGHEVHLIGKSNAMGIHGGVHCIRRDRSAVASMGLDALICLGSPDQPARLKAALGSHTRLIRWVHLPPDQPPVQSLRNPDVQRAYDAIVMVSYWQHDQFQRQFGLDPARVSVLKNAIGYPFERQFKFDESILNAKPSPPVLCYCSAPYRGLSILLDAFPRVRQAIPGTRLKVFSGLKMYGMPAENDQSTFGPLYQRCRETEGVEFVGSVTQPELARQMRDVSALAYPNIFAESFCIVAIEAMASGCHVIVSEHGALPETTAGFGRLVPIRPTLEEFLHDFAAQVIDALRSQSDSPQATEAFLRKQHDHINQSATWDIRAREWIAWIQTI